MVDDMLPKGYISPMTEVRRTEAFTSWLDALRDERAKARITSRIRMMALGNFGDHKAAGGHGVQELRIDYGPRLSRLLHPTRQAAGHPALRRRQEHTAQGRQRSPETCRKSVR